MIRLIQVSDTHLFSDPNATLLGLNTTNSFHAVLDIIKKNHDKADLMILSGDLSQDHSAESYTKLAFACESFSWPIYWLPGNHDSLEVMEQTLAKSCLREDKAIVVGNWLFILLNTHYSNHVSGLLSYPELTRLNYFLAQYPQHHTCIFLHHHPIPTGSAWLDSSLLINPDELFAITEQYSQIKAIACGHIHQSFETFYRGIPIFSAPSTCIQFLPESTEFALDYVNPGYRWFEFSSDGNFHTGVERLIQFEYTLDPSAKGY